MASASTYKVAKQLVINYNAGKGSKSKEDILNLLDIYLAGDRITEEQYNELVGMLK